MLYSQVGSFSISRLMLGGNPFSGFSHQNQAIDGEMREYYTKDRIISVLLDAEKLGINCLVARADDHVLDILAAYGLPNRPVQWLAQTAPEAGSPIISAERAARAGAIGSHIHGGVMDYYLAQNRLEEVTGIISQIRGLGLLAGIAGHKPEVFEWARDHLDVDYYMCSYYNPTPRDQHAEHIHGSLEQFLDEDREKMVALVPTLPKPVIHYKIFAAGRNHPEAAFTYAAQHMRPQDMACIGVFPKHNPRMLDEDVRLFLDAVQKVEEGLTTDPNNLIQR